MRYAHAIALGMGMRRGGGDPLARYDLTSQWTWNQGVTPAYATVSSDVENDWSQSGCTATLVSGRYEIRSDDGTTKSRWVVEVPATFATPHGWTFVFRIKAGTQGWVRVRGDGTNVNLWVNTATGAVGTDSSPITPVVTVTDLGGDGYEVSVATPSSSSTGTLYLFPAMADATANSNPSAGNELLMTVWGILPNIQTRVAVTADRKPAAVHLGQVDIAEQPGLDADGQVYDGLDDILQASSAKSEYAYAHRDGTICFVAEVLTQPTGSTYVIGDTNSVSTSVGLIIFVPGYRPDALTVRIFNGSGTDSYSENTPVGSFAVGKRVVVFSFDGTSGACWINGVEVFNVPISSPTSAADSTLDFYVGARATGTVVPPFMKVLEAGLRNGRLSDADSLGLCQALMAKWGVT